MMTEEHNGGEDDQEQTNWSPARRLLGTGKTGEQANRRRSSDKHHIYSHKSIHGVKAPYNRRPDNARKCHPMKCKRHEECKCAPDLMRDKMFKLDCAIL